MCGCVKHHLRSLGIPYTFIHMGTERRRKEEVEEDLCDGVDDDEENDAGNHRHRTLGCWKDVLHSRADWMQHNRRRRRQPLYHQHLLLLLLVQGGRGEEEEGKKKKKSSRKEKLAVLVNEFGSLGIDGAVLEAATGKNDDDDEEEEEEGGVYVKEIAGGCVCCAASGRCRSSWRFSACCEK